MQKVELSANLNSFDAIECRISSAILHLVLGRGKHHVDVFLKLDKVPLGDWVVLIRVFCIALLEILRLHLSDFRSGLLLVQRIKSAMLSKLSLFDPFIVTIDSSITKVLVITALWQQIEILKLDPEIAMKIVNVGTNRVSVLVDSENPDCAMLY